MKAGRQLIMADIGNTSVALALADECTGALLHKLRQPLIAARSDIRAAIAGLCKNRSARHIASVYASSAKPALMKPWLLELTRVADTTPLQVSSRLVLGFSLRAYARPATIGTDRLADAAAAVWRKGAPVITLDCGTATVINVVDGRGCFLGGMILPGAPLFLEYLAGRTAVLPELDWRPVLHAPAGVGRSTRSAMRLGAAVGFEGMVLAAVDHARRALSGKRPWLFLTGGHAQHLAARLGTRVVYDPDLTLTGLWRIYVLNTN